MKVDTRLKDNPRDGPETRTSGQALMAHFPPFRGSVRIDRMECNFPGYGEWFLIDIFLIYSNHS